MYKYTKIFAALALAVIGISSAAGADSIAIDPLQLMEQSRPSTGARGIAFVENISAGSSIGWIRYSHIPVFKADGSIEQSDYWNWKSCQTWTDSSCSQKNGYTIEGKVVLGTCNSEREIGCIENFKVFNSFGAGMKLTYLGKSFSGVIDTPEDLALGIPRSSSPPVYSDSEGNTYIVRGGLWVSVTGTSQPVYKLDVDITPVIKVVDNSLSAPRVVRGVDPRTGLGNVSVNPSPSTCVSTDTGICYKAVSPRSDYKYSVAVRVPRSVSGWLRGRVSEPNFDVQLLNNNSQLLTVTAKSVKMPVAGGWVKYSDLPTGFIESVWPSGGYDPNPSSSYFLVASPSQGDQGMREYVAWTPYLKEKALATITSWSFGTNIGGNDQSCLRVPGEVSGFVASNASVYSSKPPEWEASTSTLTYKVAAPHYDENGVVNAGTYTLAMPLSSIKCLYGQSNLPPSATVSIAYGDEVINVATVTLKSDSGWVYFSANGFHYSNPTIKVKFGESSSTPQSASAATPAPKPVANESAIPSPAPSQTSVSNSTPKAPVALKVQWCAKGNAKKKVTAAKPVCPKGYKKIADPTIR